jgi:hypothetical protein
MQRWRKLHRCNETHFLILESCSADITVPDTTFDYHDASGEGAPCAEITPRLGESELHETGKEALRKQCPLVTGGRRKAADSRQKTTSASSVCGAPIFMFHTAS